MSFLVNNYFALLRETRTVVFQKFTRYSTMTVETIESYFSPLVAMTSDISSFLARGPTVPLLPQVLLVLPIISHSLGLAVWSLAFMAG